MKVDGLLLYMKKTRKKVIFMLQMILMLEVNILRR